MARVDSKPTVNAPQDPGPTDPALVPVRKLSQRSPASSLPGSPPLYSPSANLVSALEVDRMEEISTRVLGVYVAAVLLETLAFMLQRVAYERLLTSGRPPELRTAFLPNWYRYSWLAVLAKWIAVFMILREAGWPSALVAAVVPFAIKTMTPVPHGPFLGVLRRGLESRRGVLDDEEIRALRSIVS